jgi:hypothetical protein
MEETSIPFSASKTESKLAAQFFSNKSDNQMKLSDIKLAYTTSQQELKKHNEIRLWNSV